MFHVFNCDISNDNNKSNYDDDNGYNNNNSSSSSSSSSSSDDNDDDDDDDDGGDDDGNDYDNNNNNNNNNNGLSSIDCLPTILVISFPLLLLSTTGWIKTLTRYYQDQTSKILDQMVIKMQEYPKMTFIWAEISYFSMWWDTADYNKKQVVKR